MHDQTPVYFTAAQYCCDQLGTSASRYLSRLHRLAQTNNLEELQSIIRGWAAGLQPPTPEPKGPWAVGSFYGLSLLVQHLRGVFYKLKCPCGAFYTASCNYTTPEHLRLCSECQIQELAKQDPAIIERLKTGAALVREWYPLHHKLIWMKIHNACLARNITDENFKQELQAMVWAKILEKATRYEDRGFKVTAWLGTVAHNALIDWFDKEWNYQKHVVPFFDDADDKGIPNPEDRLPARKASAQGAGPDTVITLTELSPVFAATR